MIQLSDSQRAILSAACARERLEAGDIILAGGATAAHPLSPGMHVRSLTQGPGAVSFVVEG
ncbi:hypothetical protein [Magnetospirillum sp. 15-1]|uniref:hypothetical protein n=1 Tax=Magnetospirillum sp. 15-1 TaxID=1979370 RepID=UPI000BBC7F50|nr:hypothetical protein [Magnetospirillum sp. 15-1]